MKFLLRAQRIVINPRSEWDAISAEAPPWHAALLNHALPLALLPSLAWSIGRGVLAWPMDSPPHLTALIEPFILTLVFSVSAVALLGLGFYLFMPLYERRRSWGGALAVAAYGSTPVLLSGALLFAPILIIVSTVTLLHCFYLYYVGVQRVLGVRASESASLIALACGVNILSTWLLGALGSWLGAL